MRIYFVTDIHGSDVCFRKFLNSAPIYNPDVMIVGGDITGKVLIPIVSDGDASATAVTNQGDVPLENAETITAFEAKIADTGSYTWRCTPDELDAAQQDPDHVHELFVKAVGDRVRAWTDLAAERLRDPSPRVLISGGNDDFWEIDDILRSAPRIECPDREVVGIGEGIEMLSLGAANETPWNCPRDLPEPELQRAIDDLAVGLRGGSTIFNLHVPPYNTRLDVGPALVDGNRPRLGMTGMETAPVGSTAVRESIERYQPMLSLHGHVHESRATDKLGKTLAINPGSEYNQGLLRSALVDIRKGKVKRHQLLCG
jgi:Icc-related predicted phosphoesterase